MQVGNDSQQLLQQLINITTVGQQFLDQIGYDLQNLLDQGIQGVKQTFDPTNQVVYVGNVQQGKQLTDDSIKVTANCGGSVFELKVKDEKEYLFFVVKR